MRRLLLLLGALPPFLFILACQRTPDIEPEELAKLYAERVLLYKEGYEGCLKLIESYGFYHDEKGEKRLADKKTAEDFCQYYKDPLRQVGFKNAPYRVEEEEKRQVSDGRWVARYEVVFQLPEYEYRRSLTFEKLKGRWRIYLIKM